MTKIRRQFFRPLTINTDIAVEGKQWNAYIIT